MSDKYRFNKTNTIIGVVFTLCAAIMVAVIVSMTVSWNDFKETAEPAQALITNIETSTRRSGGKTRKVHTVFVEYEYNGEYYSNRLNYYDSSMHKGKTIEILVDPAEPYKVMTNPAFANMILAVFVLIFGGVGVGLTAHEFKMSAYINKLIADNKYIFADYKGEVLSNTRVNNVRYTQSEFVYSDGFSKELNFKSHPHHPANVLYTHGDSVKVYIDLEGDMKKYYVTEKGGGKEGF